MDIEKLRALSSEDRKSVLESEALSIEEGKYTKPLGNDELAFYKDQLADKSIQQATILDELKTVKDEFKARLEPVQLEIKKSLSAVKFKAKDGKAFLMVEPTDDENDATQIAKQLVSFLNSSPVLESKDSKTVSEEGGKENQEKAIKIEDQVKRIKNEVAKSWGLPSFERLNKQGRPPDNMEAFFDACIKYALKTNRGTALI